MPSKVTEGRMETSWNQRSSLRARNVLDPAFDYGLIFRLGSHLFSEPAYRVALQLDCQRAQMTDCSSRVAYIFRVLETIEAGNRSHGFRGESNE